MEFSELWLAILSFLALSIWVYRHYHIRPLLRRIKDQVREFYETWNIQSNRKAQIP